jgi:hypothetical protein
MCRAFQHQVAVPPEVVRDRHIRVELCLIEVRLVCSPTPLISSCQLLPVSVYRRRRARPRAGDGRARQLAIREGVYRPVSPCRRQAHAISTVSERAPSQDGRGCDAAEGALGFVQGDGKDPSRAA